MREYRRGVSITAIILGAVLNSSYAHAQQNPASDDDAAMDVGDIVVTGTRLETGSPLESALPVDAISRDQLSAGGRVDALNALRVTVPSINFPTTTGSTFADFAAPLSLRGLSPGQTLVLVNGRRRHSIGELNQSNSLGRGDITYDLNPIPLDAIGRIEVLRDGAAAIYGSDAIAGVVNVVLDTSLGGRARLTTGITDQADGEVISASLSYGFAVGEEGRIRVTTMYREQNGTNRAGADTRQQYLGSNGTRAPSALFGSGIGLTPSAGTLDPREATIDRNQLFVIGQSPFDQTSAIVNAEIPLSETIVFTGFAGYSRLDGQSKAFFRRAGQDETVRSIYPDGFRPNSLVNFDDYTASAMIASQEDGPFGWSLATTYGGSEIGTTPTLTANPSLGASSPTTFFRGGTTNRQWTNNLDLTYAFDVGDGSPLRFAAGVEYREDHYRLIAGDPASFANGGALIVGGPNNGRPAPAGAQPVPGVRDVDAIAASRSSLAVYGEVEKTLFDRLTLQAALRYEDFSDFGDTTDFRVAGRFEVTPWLAVRGSYGTGFRAPALAQSFFSAGSVSFINGVPVTVRIFRVDEPAAALLGATALRPEQSRSLSAGAVFDLDRFSLTVDAYRVVVDDRIVISSQFQDARVTTLLANNGFPGFSAATFLTNAVDSVTRGVDITARYTVPLGGNARFSATFAANFNESRLTRIAGTPGPLAALGVTTPLFDLTQQVRFTDSQPKDKAYLRLELDVENIRLRLTNTRYGEVSAVALTNRTPAQVDALRQNFDLTLLPVSATSPNFDVIQTFQSRVLTDFEVELEISPSLTLSAGINNLFDAYPTVNLPSTVASVVAGTNGSDNGGPIRYNPIAPSGFNGRSYFVTLGAKF